MRDVNDFILSPNYLQMLEKFRASGAEEIHAIEKPNEETLQIQGWLGGTVQSFFVVPAGEWKRKS